MRVEGENVDLLHQTNPDLPPQVGVFVVTDAAGKAVAHDIAMHVAAYMPAYLDRDSVPGRRASRRSALPSRRSRLRKASPPTSFQDPLRGRLNAFYKDNCPVDRGLRA